MISDPAWVLKTASGYKLLSHDGTYKMFFTMPADCKSYCTREKINVTMISHKTDQITLQRYKNATGLKYYHPITGEIL